MSVLPRNWTEFTLTNLLYQEHYWSRMSWTTVDVIDALIFMFDLLKFNIFFWFEREAAWEDVSTTSKYCLEQLYEVTLLQHVWDPYVYGSHMSLEDIPYNCFIIYEIISIYIFIYVSICHSCGSLESNDHIICLVIGRVSLVFFFFFFFFPGN